MDMKTGCGVVFLGFHVLPHSPRFSLVRELPFDAIPHYFRDVSSTQPPEHLYCLFKLLKVRGEQIMSPGEKQGLLPLAVPLSKYSSGSITTLLRWPTAPAGMEMPVVEVHKYGVWLLAKIVEQYINRILVEEDVKNTEERNEEYVY